MSGAVEVIVAPSMTERQRDQRIAVFETIGCALATLRRLDSVWYDEDIRTTITAVRSSLSVAQSKVKERIEKTIVERKQE